MKRNKIILYMFLLVGLFSACKEDTRVGILDAPDQAKVAIIHVASDRRPGSSQQLGYFYLLDNQRVLSQPLVSNRTTGYTLVSPGTHTLRFDSVAAIVNITNKLPATPVKSVTLNADANKYYSVYLSGRVQAPEVLVTTDDISRPAEGKAKIRFVNVSPDLAGVDLAGALSRVTSARPVLFSNSNYNTSSDFISVDAGNYAFELRGTGTSTVIGTQSRTGEVIPQIGQVSTANVNSFTLLIESGKVYTLIARGYRVPASVVGQTVFPLSITGVINSYF